MKLKFELDLFELNASLDYLKKGLYGLRQESALRVANEIMQESLEIIPVDTGAMASTNYIEFEGTEVVFGYVGRGHDTMNLDNYAMVSSYILRQHEDLDYQHAPGKEAKFLENPIERHRDEAEEMFAEDYENLFTDWKPKWRGRGKPRGRGVK